MRTLRPYRQQSSLMGQTSPPILGLPVLIEVAGGEVVDVGSGSGVYGYMLRVAWQFTGAWQRERIPAPTRLEAIDWSPSTVDLLRDRGPYDEVHLARADRLPVGDKKFDTALSMENLRLLQPQPSPRQDWEAIPSQKEAPRDTGSEDRPSVRPNSRC